MNEKLDIANSIITDICQQTKLYYLRIEHYLVEAVDIYIWFSIFGINRLCDDLNNDSEWYRPWSEEK